MPGSEAYQRYKERYVRATPGYLLGYIATFATAAVVFI